MCQSCAIVKHLANQLPIGNKYGRWTVIDNNSKVGYAKCKCECGAIRYVSNYSLTSKTSRSCGCLASDIARENAYKTFKEIWKANKGVDIKKDPRQTRGYDLWREFVLARDRNHCVRCKKSAELNTHHIIAVKKDPSLALDPKNGICLCLDCHKELHRRYNIRATREDTNSFVREINTEFNLDEWTNMYPEINDVSIHTRKVYKLDELIR